MTPTTSATARMPITCITRSTIPPAITRRGIMPRRGIQAMRPAITGEPVTAAQAPERPGTEGPPIARGDTPPGDIPAGAEGGAAIAIHRAAMPPDITAVISILDA